METALRKLAVLLYLASMFAGCAAGAVAPIRNASNSSGAQSAVGALSSPIDATRTDETVLKYIESTVSAADQPIVYDALSLLPESERDNVIILLSNRSISNRPEFIESRNVPEAATFPSPPACVVGGSESCTGSFRQHRSKPGGSYFQASLTLSCNNSHFTPTPYAAGFMYISNYATDNATDWEGGIEEDPPGAGPGNPANIIPYVKEQGYNEDQLSSIGDPRLSCSQPSSVIIETYILQKSGTDTSPNAILVLNGTWSVPPNGGSCVAGSNCTVVYMHPLLKNASSYKQTCTTCLLYWTTSIADSSTVYEVANNWFGMSQAGVPGAAQPVLAWTNAETATFGSYGGTASAAPVPFPQATVFNDPASVANLIYTLGGTTTGETIGIDEHGNIGGTIR